MIKHKFLPFLAVLAMLAGPAQAEPACPALVITGHPAYMPVAWAADGAIIGAAPELVRTIAAKLGVKTVRSQDYGSWEQAQAAVRNGEADVIFGIYKNAGRMTWLDFVEPAFMLDPVAIVVRQGEGFGFAQWSQLKGRQGVTNAGESFGDKFDAFMASDLTVKRTQGVDKAFMALLDKSADYLIIGRYPGQIEAKKLGVVSKVEFLAKEVDSFGMYVAFSKNSKCKALQAGFAEHLRQEVAAGRVQTLLDAANRRLDSRR